MVETLGGLRHRVEVQDATYVSDSRGGFTETWATSSTIWADVIPLSGRELFYADLESRKVTHRIVMRPRSLDAQKQRIMFGDRMFKIQYVRDPLPGAMRGYIEVMVTE